MIKNLQWRPVSKQEFVKYLKKKILNKGKPQLRNRLSCFTILLVVYRYILKVKLLGLLATTRTVAYQDPPSMGFSRQEYWSGLPFPSPGDLPNPETEPKIGRAHV